MIALVVIAGLVAVIALQVFMFVARGRDACRREAELLERNEVSSAMEQRVTALLATANDAVVIMADEGELLWTSSSFTRLLGWEGPVDRVLAREMIHPNDMKGIVAVVRDVREGRRVVATIDVRVRHSDGHWVLTQQTLRDCRRDPVIGGIVITFRDMTEHRRVVGELTDEVNRYRFLAENASEALIMASADRTISYASATTSVVLDRRPEALIGIDVCSLVHPDDRALVDAALTHAQWTGDVSRLDARAYLSSLDEYRWVHLVTRCIAGHTGDKQYHVSLSDISARRDAETAVAASEQRFRSLASQTRELVTMIDLRGVITYMSPSVHEVLGHDHLATVGHDVRTYLHHDEYDDLMHRIIEQSTTEALRHRAIHADGSYRWLETLAQVLTDHHGARVSVLLSSRDITERLQLEQHLDRERGLLAAILDSVHAGVVAVDRAGKILDANQAFCELLGTQFVTGTSIMDYVSTHDLQDEHGRSVPVAERPLEVALSGRSMTDELFVVVTNDGVRREVVANATALVGDEGQIDGAVLTYEDITLLRAAQDELRRLATLDPLTGLPNRRHLLVSLADALQRHARAPDRLALLFLDLDGFKPVNDTLGHEIGDELLRQAASRITAIARPGDLVARYGGDEFVVVAENIGHRDDALALAQRIESVLALPFDLAGTTTRIGCSVGVTLAVDAISIDDLLDRADQAMYERKKQRKEQAAAAALCSDEPVLTRLG